MSMVIIPHHEIQLYSRRYHIFKFFFDLTICLFLLPVILPILAIASLAIRLDSPGPIFFTQDRIGKGGRRFRMYKLRTMQHNLDDSSHRVFMKGFVNGEAGKDTGSFSGQSFILLSESGEVEDDKNVHKPFEPSQLTRVGRILRKTSIDELPQIINVLKREMSWIGPRPNVPWEVEEYQPWHHERLELLPGVTGLAQVRGRSSITFERIARYDIEYIEKHSIIFDLKILFWTISQVIAKKGAG